MISKLLTRQTIQTILTKTVPKTDPIGGQIVLNVRYFSKTLQMNRIENVLIVGSGLMGSGIQSNELNN